MKILGIIPSRFGSSRLPGKPLALIGEKPMIQRVYEQACKAQKLSGVVVATDDERILQVIEGIGGTAILTSPEHPSGTDRLIEVMKHFPGVDGSINIQGDEPFIHPEEIDRVAEILSEKGNEFPMVATLVKKLSDPELLSNPSTIKVVRTPEGKAIYFSRSPIPFLRNVANVSEWPTHHNFWQHIGIYGYNTAALSIISKISPSILEKAESLEQLRWIENGIPIFTAEVAGSGFSIDTPEDLERARLFYKNIFSNER